MPEEEAFAVVVKLMQEYRLREIFKPSMAELGLVLYQMKHLVEASLVFVFVCVHDETMCWFSRFENRN